MNNAAAIGAIALDLLALRSENFALSNYRLHRNIMWQRINGADSSCVISDADGEGVMGQAR